MSPDDNLTRRDRDTPPPKARDLKSRAWTEVDSLGSAPVSPKAPLAPLKAHGAPERTCAPQWEPPGLVLAHIAIGRDTLPPLEDLAERIGGMDEAELLEVCRRAKAVRRRSVMHQCLVGAMLTYFFLSVFVFPALIEHRVWLFKWL